MEDEMKTGGTELSEKEIREAEEAIESMEELEWKY